MFICSVFPSAQILVVTQPGMNIQDFHFSGRFVWHSIVIRSLSLIFQTTVRAQQFPVPPDFVSCYCRYCRPQITQYPAAIDTIPSDVALTTVLNFQHEFPKYFQKDSVLTVPTSWSARKRPIQTASDAVASFSCGYNSFHFTRRWWLSLCRCQPKMRYQNRGCTNFGAANPL